MTGAELRKCDGTEAGTVLVRLPGGLPLQCPRLITVASDRLFVVGSRPEVGGELFTQVLVDPPALAGDFDRNGIVDQADRDVGVADFGSGTRLRADGNGDGFVDAADYTVWRDNLGAGIPAPQGDLSEEASAAQTPVLFFTPKPSGVATVSPAQTPQRASFQQQRAERLLLAVDAVYARWESAGPDTRPAGADTAPEVESSGWGGVDALAVDAALGVGV